MTDSTVEFSWPDSKDVVFLCDANSGHERSILRSFVSEAKGPVGAAPPRSVRISLDGSREIDNSELTQILGQSDSTCLVPLRVAWLPDRDTAQSRPRLQDLVLGDLAHPRLPVARYLRRRKPSQARCVMGASATIGQLRERYELQGRGADEGEHGEDFNAFVLRQAATALEVEERKLKGRRYKVPRFVIRGVENSPRYRSSTKELAEQMGRTTAEIRGKARGYLTEMVATPNAFFIDWMGTLTSWITSLGYREVVTDPANVERARAQLSDHPSALLFTHKSHVDGIALMSVMYDNDFPAAHAIGGINMAFKGVGYAGRRAGTIFIRRTFTDNDVYRMALQQYLGYLMDKRFPLSWAFEGTRSRTGKLGPPRYGMLKYVVEAAHETAAEDLHLIPVSISYDLIGEAGEYAREQSGQPKEAESLGWFMDYLRKLRAPMGNIYLDFAEPVVLSGKTPKPTEQSLPPIAFEVARRVNDQVRVTLPSVMCMALLAAPGMLTRAEFEQSVRALLDWLLARRIRMARGLARMDLPELESIAENVFQAGVLDRVTEDSETLYGIGDDKVAVAGYYRNNIVHYFVNQAIAEVALARVVDLAPDTRAVQFEEDAFWLRGLTKFEFFHTPSEEFPAALDTELKYSDKAWRAALAGSSGDVAALLSRVRPRVSHTVLLPLLEAYWLLATVAAESSHEDALDRNALVGKALVLGRKALRKRQLYSRASVGKDMFRNAFSYLGDQGLVEAGGQEVGAGRQALVARLDETIRRVRRSVDVPTRADPT